jgi:hypothetical protein
MQRTFHAHPHRADAKIGDYDAEGTIAAGDL